MSAPTEISTSSKAGAFTGAKPPSAIPPRFDFERDSFAFANELLWEYAFDAASGKTRFTVRDPKPDYTLRCFVLVRAARQFFDHARFVADADRAGEGEYRRLIRAVLARDPRKSCVSGEEILIPGYAGLREFSRAREGLLKAECGAAWRSYVMRSHWRMIVPVSRQSQVQAVAQLKESVHNHGSAIVHLFRFPALSINHGMLVFKTTETKTGADFEAYDPNDTEKPTHLSYDRAARTFYLPPTRYWAGGWLNVFEIYRTWFL